MMNTPLLVDARSADFIGRPSFVGRLWEEVCSTVLVLAATMAIAFGLIEV
jgi:hypothetical protein